MLCSGYVANGRPWSKTGGNLETYWDSHFTYSGSSRSCWSRGAISIVWLCKTVCVTARFQKWTLSLHHPTTKSHRRSFISERISVLTVVAPATNVSLPTGRHFAHVGTNLLGLQALSHVLQGRLSRKPVPLLLECKPCVLVPSSVLSACIWFNPISICLLHNIRRVVLSSREYWYCWYYIAANGVGCILKR